ncbi:MAG TPA: hypothetical protein VNS50_03615 [Ginsengibacter sp.]|nr:hypothetical protein [Ginsengibacter sp.]
MKFKKIIPLLLITMLAGFITPVFAADDSPVGAEKTAKDVRSQELTNRLIEIRDMDKSNLTSSEKRELRKEVKEIRKAHSNHGIYLSIGAIIIIILLLILLL